MNRKPGREGPTYTKYDGGKRNKRNYKMGRDLGDRKSSHCFIIFCNGKYTEPGIPSKGQELGAK